MREEKKSPGPLWIHHDYNSGSAACDTTNSSTMKKHREGGKKERKQQITRRDGGRGGTSLGISRRRRKRPREGGHRTAWLASIHDETQKSTSIKRFSSPSMDAVSYYSPRPLEALRPPSHPAPGTQIKPSLSGTTSSKKAFYLSSGWEEAFQGHSNMLALR